MTRWPALASPLVSLLWIAVWGLPALADDLASEDAVPEVAKLSGKDIYSRVLENRLRASYMQEVLTSVDAAGNGQKSSLWIRFKDYRDDVGKTEEAVQAKFLIKYTDPRDMRGAGYLVIQNEGRPDDQFIYFPSNRKVKRVNLSDTILGTDFSVEDIVPRGLEDSEYQRLPDAIVDELPCYVVEVRPREIAESQYARLEIYVHRERWIPVQTRYWDKAGVAVKEYRIDAGSIDDVKGVSVARLSEMRSLQEKSATRREVLNIDHEPDIRDSMFSIPKLKSRR